MGPYCKYDLIKRTGLGTTLRVNWHEVYMFIKIPACSYQFLIKVSTLGQQLLFKCHHLTVPHPHCIPSHPITPHGQPIYLCITDTLLNVVMSRISQKYNMFSGWKENVLCRWRLAFCFCGFTVSTYRMPWMYYLQPGSAPLVVPGKRFTYLH